METMNQVKILRERYGYSPEKIAYLLEVSRTAVLNWEGEINKPLPRHERRLNRLIERELAKVQREKERARA